MTFDTSQAAAYGVLFSVLGIFAFIAIASANYLRCCLPARLNKIFVLRSASSKEASSTGDPTEEGLTADFFLSARNSASAAKIAFSFFAAGMGSWVLYGPTELGAIPSLSWLAIIGYAIASASPAIVVCFVGPRMRKICQEKSFSITDFGRKRFGRIMQVVIGIIGTFYLFIYIVAEMTAISNIFGLICGLTPDEQSTTRYTVGVAVAVGAVTLTYTSIAGLPSSIVTSIIQSLVMIILVLLLLFALTLNPQNKITKEDFALVSNWTTDGLMTGVTLILAVLSAEMFNLGTWQRVWAAEDDRAMRRGFAAGSAMVFLLMMFFGVMGMLGYALDPSSYDNGTKYAYLAFFNLLEPLSNAWHIITLILVTALTTSTVDTLQNALLSTLSSDLIKSSKAKWISRFLVVAINIPAIILSAKRYDVISLFLVADLVCATSVLPLMLGFLTEDKLYGWIPAPTELGAFLGCISGLGTVLVIGRVFHAEGGVFHYFWLPNGAVCSLCGYKTMITFIITVISGGFFALLFSKLDILIRGERARRPLLGKAVEEESVEEKALDVTRNDISAIADVEDGRNPETATVGDVVTSG
jgi:SSS family solute:Na+ symporter